MNEILPGIFHWTVVHPETGSEVSCYFLSNEKMLIDPLIPAEGLDWFEKYQPTHIVLTNKSHIRHTDEFYKRFDCDVHAQRAGAPEVGTGRQVKPFGFGNYLPGGVLAVEVQGISKEEVALFINQQDGIVAFGDALCREKDGPLSFLPDELLGKDAEAIQKVKEELLEAFRKILEKHEFENMFFAHGEPWISGGKKELAQFVKKMAGRRLVAK